MPTYRRTEGERLLALEDEVAKLKTALSRREALNTVAGGDFTIMNDGTIQSSNFDGDLDVPSVGTQGWAMGGPFGAAAIATLLLRPGSVTNDALANPVASDVFTGSPGGTFAYTTTADTVIYSGSITVPAGFSQALVVAFGAASGYNDQAGYGVLACRLKIAGNSGPGAGSGTTPGGTISTPAQHARKLTGLVGGTISVQLCGWNQISAGWSTTSGNNGALTAFAIFSR